MAKYLDRKAVLKALKALLADENDYSDLYHDGYVDGVYDAEDAVKGLPSANIGGVLERNIDNIRQAGHEGKEFRFRIGGRIFAVRELPQ